MTDNDLDRSIEERLRAYESRVAGAPAPGLDEAPGGRAAGSPDGRWLRPTLMIATAAAAVVLAVFLVDRLPDRTVGDATPSPSAAGEVSASARNGDFVLTLSSPQSTWTTDDAIRITATLTYDGDEPEVEIGGGGGPVVFSLRQLEGGDAVLGGGQELPCLRYSLGPNAPLVWPFQKAGGVDDIPPFDRAFFDDRQLHLPPGSWEVRAVLEYGGPDCGNNQVLEVSITIDVLEAAGSPGPSPAATEPAEASSPPEPIGTLAISRDGDVLLVRPDGTTVSQLTDDAGSDEAPVAWLLDGSALVVAVTADENPYSSTLRLVSADGAESTELGVVHPVYGASVRSPDGTRMAFGGDGSPASGIKVLDLADGTLASLTDDGGSAPLWSPDGTLIAYNAPDGNGTDVYVVPAHGGDPVALAAHPAQDQVIRWAATDDGLKIVFESWRDTDESKLAGRPWVMNADGTQVELLAESSLDVDLATREPPSVTSPNGEWIVTVYPTGAFVGRDPVAGDERLLPETRGWDISELSPSFSPDGRFLAYSHAAGREEPRNVVAIVLLTPGDPAPIEPEIITIEGVSERAPAWRPVP